MTGALSVPPIDLALSKSQSKSSKTFLHELINKLNLPKQLFVHGFLCVSYFGESKHEWDPSPFCQCPHRTKRTVGIWNGKYRSRRQVDTALKDEVVNSRPVVMEVQSFRQTLLGLVQPRIFLRLSNFQHVDCLCRNLAFGLVWWEGEDFRLGISRLNTGLPCSPATATFMSFAILRCKINDGRQPSSSSS